MMSTLRNLVVAALLVLAAVVIRQQPISAVGPDCFEMAEYCEGSGGHVDPLSGIMCDANWFLMVCVINGQPGWPTGCCTNGNDCYGTPVQYPGNCNNNGCGC
jgi:hypothetical protein